jgi:hypothetical protein
VRYLAREGTYVLRGGMKRAPVFMKIRTLVGHGGGVVRTRKVSTLPQSLRENNFTIINYIHSTIRVTILHHLDTSCLGLEVSDLACRVLSNSPVADKTYWQCCNLFCMLVLLSYIDSVICVFYLNLL